MVTQITQITQKQEKTMASSYIDMMVSMTKARFNRSKLKPILEDLGLKSGYSIGGDLGYQSLKLYDFDAEVRQYDNGKVYVYFGYDDKAGAWGGYTRKYEVKDPDVFKSPRWKSIIMESASAATPDVIMI